MTIPPSGIFALGRGLATHTLAFERDSQVRFFQGNVTDYEEFRHTELGAAADQPHRIKCKRLAAA